MQKSIKFFKSALKELKLMKWPKSPEVFNLMKIVLFLALIIVLYTLVLDTVLNYLLFEII